MTEIDIREANQRLLERRKAEKALTSQVTTLSTVVPSLVERIKEKERPPKPRNLKCRKCGQAYPALWDDFLGRWYYPNINPGAEICTNCREKEEGEEKLKEIRGNIDTYLRRIGVPPKYLGCSFENFITNGFNQKNLEACKEYAKNPEEGLFLYGKYGTGKTHLSVAIARELVLKGKEVVFTSVPKLLFEIRRAFQSGASDTEEFYINRYSSYEHFILDDFGVEKTTEWARQTLDHIIYERDNNLKPTVITSNLSLDEITEKIDGRISSRLAGMGRVIQFNGPDFRLKRNEVK